jgi:hypothetical protein
MFIDVLSFFCLMRLGIILETNLLRCSEVISGYNRGNGLEFNQRLRFSGKKSKKNYQT